MSFFGEEFSRQMNESRASAKKAPRGMDVAHLVPGAIVTISANLHTGDRSYADNILSVVATNGGSIVLEVVFPEKLPSWRSRRVLLAIHEHHWYPAEHVLDAMRPPADPYLVAVEATQPLS